MKVSLRGLNTILCRITEAYLEPCQTSKIDRFAKIGNGFSCSYRGHRQEILTGGMIFLHPPTEPAITCSKLTIETKGGVVLVSLMLTLNIFHALF